ncbi:MAG: PadR family transcriptional regulator [Chloroflexota bacterium]
MARNGDFGEDFAAHGHQPKLALRGFLLLLLAEHSAHGYDLIERLDALGLDTQEPAAVYKALRHMDQERLVSSAWKLSAHGPARRVYSLTPEGRDLLEEWVLVVRHSRATLDLALERHQRLDAHHPGAD